MGDGSGNIARFGFDENPHALLLSSQSQSMRQAQLFNPNLDIKLTVQIQGTNAFTIEVNDIAITLSSTFTLPWMPTHIGLYTDSCTEANFKNLCIQN